MKNGLIFHESMISDEDIKLINQFTKRNFNKNEVYVFSSSLSDNEIDNCYERFTTQMLEKLSKLLVGKTGTINHNGEKKQYAKIFSCKVEYSKEKNSIGELYCKLIAKIYIPRTKDNENLISEIDSGMKDKVKIEYSVNKELCSICNKDFKTCTHKKGERYGSFGAEMLCYSNLDDPTEIYSWSLDTSSIEDDSGEFMETNSENIIEKLKNITNKNKLYKLYEMIKTLEDDVYIGRKYVSELKNDVMKHFTFLNPQIDSSSLKKMINVLSIDDLEKMKKRFSSSNMKLQLFSSKKANVNYEYKI